MRIVYRITDEIIRYSLEDSLRELEDENMVSFPDENARSEFIENCVENVISKFETHSYYYDSAYNPNYDDIVFDSAKWDGYLKEEAYK